MFSFGLESGLHGRPFRSNGGRKKSTRNMACNFCSCSRLWDGMMCEAQLVVANRKMLRQIKKWFAWGLIRDQGTLNASTFHTSASIWRAAWINRATSSSQGCHESFFPLSQRERVDCVLHTSLMLLLCKLLIPSHHNVRLDIFIHEHTRTHTHTL